MRWAPTIRGHWNTLAFSLGISVNNFAVILGFGFYSVWIIYDRTMLEIESTDG